MTFIHRWTRTCALAALLLTFACTDGGSDADLEELPDAVTVVVGAKGGQVKAKGVSLEIPEGALDKDVTITAKSTDKPAPADKTAVSKVFEFGPAGTKFAKDVTVSIDTDKHEPQAKVFFTKEGSDKDFEQLPTEVKEKSASAKVRHFSLGFVGLDGSLSGMDASTGTDDPSGGSRDASAGGDADGGVKPSEPDGQPDASTQARRITVSSKDLYGRLANQTWGAYQDGDGPWEPLPPPVSTGTYEITVTSSRYGVAFVCEQAGGESYGKVLLAPSSSTSQTIDAPEPCMGLPPDSYSVLGTVSPAATAALFRWSHPFNGGGITASSPTSYEIPGFPVAIPVDAIVVSTDANAVPIKLAFLRDLAASTNLTGQNIDLNTQGSGVALSTFTVDNGGTYTNIDITLTTRGSSVGMWLHSGNVTGTPPSRNYVGLTNPALLRATDRYRFYAYEDYGETYHELEYLSPVSGNLSASFPPALDATLFRSGGEYIRPTATFTAVANASAYEMYFNHAPLEVTHEFTTHIEAGWFEGTPSEFTFPDFSSVQGYNSDWFAPNTENFLNTTFCVLTNSPVSGGGTLRTKSQVYSDLIIPR